MALYLMQLFGLVVYVVYQADESLVVSLCSNKSFFAILSP